MFRRSILQLTSRSSVHRVPLRTTTQVPAYLSSRRSFSASGGNEPHKLGSASDSPESKSKLPKLIGAALVLGPVVFGAYYYGVLDKYIGTEQKRMYEHAKSHEHSETPIDNKKAQESPNESTYQQSSELSELDVGRSFEEPNVSSSTVDHAEKDSKTHADQNQQEDSVTSEGVFDIQEKDAVAGTEEVPDNALDKDLPDVPASSVQSVDVTSKVSEESVVMKSPDVKTNGEQDKGPIFPSADGIPTDIETKTVPAEQTPTPDAQEVVLSDGKQIAGSLLDDYYLRNNLEESTKASSSEHKDVISVMDDEYDGYISRDGKLVLDFLQAIHAAEERQAAVDARSFAEEKRALKIKYEKELKDARARELMYAEREAILDKELNKEKLKAAAALESLQKKLEEKLKLELEEKEREAKLKLKEMSDIARAELAAAIANEKASRIEKMAEADLHINALCMAFYARSEEARQSHSVHKLALGALALEDALSKGLPIRKEVEVLHTHFEGTENDSLISLVLSSLPEDTQKHGTDTLAQLNHKFDALKGTLRHFSLIPPGGGGILTHSLAHIASWLKIKEVDQSGDGIESLINRVENLIAQGKLSEAADALENGVKGSQAAEVVDDWVRQARNRAITEQALTVLQSYATSVSVT